MKRLCFILYIVVSLFGCATISRYNYRQSPEVFSLPSYNNHTGDITSIDFSPDSKVLASGSYDETVKLWQVKSGELIATLKGHSGPVTSVTFSTDGKVLASGSYDETVKLWDVESGKELTTLKGHFFSVTSVNFSPDGRMLASGSGDTHTILWDLKNDRVFKTFKCLSSITSVSFSPDGKTLAVSCNDPWGKICAIQFWDIGSGNLLTKLKGHSNFVTSVDFSPDSKVLASGSYDQTIKLWDVKTSKILNTLKGHSGSITSISFSPDGNFLASSGGIDKTIQLWDVKTGKILNTLKGHSSSVTSVCFSPKGRLLASVDANTIKLWYWDDKSGLKNFKGNWDPLNRLEEHSDIFDSGKDHSEAPLNALDIIEGRVKEFCACTGPPDPCPDNCKVFVVLTRENNFYYVPNIEKDVLIRHKNQKVRVTGKASLKFNAIFVTEMEVFKEGEWKTVWLNLFPDMKKEIDKQIQESGAW